MKKTITLIMASVMLMLANSSYAFWDNSNWNNSNQFDGSCCYEDPCCDDDTGFYVGGFAGANWIQTTKDRGYKRKFDTGYALTASIGYRWCYNLRFEFEYGYRRNQAKKHHHSTSGSHGRGHLTTNSYLFNGFWDIPWCNDWNLKPFIGGGIGYARERERGHGLSVVGSGHRNRKNGFAWQVIAGVAYPICDIADISLEYRFFKGRQNHIFNHAFGAGMKYYF